MTPDRNRSPKYNGIIPDDLCSKLLLVYLLIIFAEGHPTPPEVRSCKEIVKDKNNVYYSED